MARIAISPTADTAAKGDPLDKSGTLTAQPSPLEPVALEELESLPLARSGGQLQFRHIGKHFERPGVIITANLAFDGCPLAEDEGAAASRRS